MTHNQLPPALENQEDFRALYLHVPFCKQRCLYCDFTTEAVEEGSSAIRAYTEDMILAIRRAAREGLLGAIETVYVGGGTPSFVGSKSLSEILYTLGLSMHLTDDVECTVEANPDSLSLALVRDIYSLGANRLSVGVQSFNDDELRTLGRIHDADTARRSIDIAHERFSNVSIDLMCGIPGQTLESFTASLETAVSLGITHISIYPLTIEDGTPFARKLAAGDIADVDPDFQADCMEAAAQFLETEGFARYEVASYAHDGFACRHNKAYWTGVPYLGLGLGATTMAQNATERVRIKEGEVLERLDAAEMLAEDLMLALRMTEGAPAELIEAATLVFPQAQATFDTLIERGLARWKDGRLVPTARGWLCGNELYGALYELA